MKLIKTPKSVDLDVTNNCNLRCTYCYHFTSAGDVAQDLPLAEWTRFIEELGRCAVMDVTIAGGEPFYRSDLKEIISAIVRNRMRFVVLSNGTLITAEMAAFIASTKRCNQVQVSIDGSTPGVHDSFRGKGNFEKAIDGIKNLKNAGVNIAVRVTIHRRNVHDLEGIAKLLLEDAGLPSFSTNSAHYMGLCAKNTEMVQLTLGEQFIAMQKLLELNQKYNHRIGAAAGPLANARAWQEMENARRKGKENIPGKGFLVSCGGVYSKIAVRADGMMVPCNQMSHIELGRINRGSLEDIWQNHPELKRLRERRNTPLNEFDFCRGCDYINYCAGGCPAMAYTTAGSDFHPSMDSCLKRYLDQGGKLPQEEVMVDA